MVFADWQLAEGSKNIIKYIYRVLQILTNIFRVLQKYICIVLQKDTIFKKSKICSHESALCEKMSKY